MHPSLVLGAGAALAVAGWFLSARADDTANSAALAAPPPVANGHYVLVVEGDRDALAITHARAKADPWAGAPAGLRSDWRLEITDAHGQTLADVPLDVSQFATGAGARGTTHVEGCVVRSARIAMLVNVPAFATAATYTFTRLGDAGGSTLLGAIAGATVRELAGGGR